jgi:hypothetical protein
MEMTAVMGREERQKLFPSLPTLPWKARKNRELPTFPQLRRRLGVSFFSQARLTSTSTKSVTYMPGTFCYRHARSHTIDYMTGFSPCLSRSLPNISTLITAFRALTYTKKPYQK